ncbi:MAG: hypothetical protein AAF281_10495, partial [Pseudomonadota bacterium]
MTVFRGIALVVVLALAVGAWRSGPFGPSGPLAVRPDTGLRAATLRDADLRPVVAALLAQVYSAFEAQDEFEIYDGIAAAVAPELAAPLYLQRRAAQLREAVDGETRLLDLEILQLDVRERATDGITLAAEWLVAGEVGHEDHRHERLNAYAATLTL